MFSRVKGFLSRHRRKFIVTGVVVGGLVLASRYAQRKFREWQERETREFLERTRRQQHFESTERTCNQTILSLSPKLIEAIAKGVDTEELVKQLRSGHPNKLPIWEELKVLAFTKASVVVYAYAMLVVMLRVQLNLIGGYMYRQLNEDETDSSNISNVVQEKYLSLVHHFLSNGINGLIALVQSKVQFVMGGIPLKRRLNLNDTEQLFWALQAAVGSDKKDPAKNITIYVLPSDSTVAASSSSEENLLNTMILETTDILESEEVISLLSSLVSQGFSGVVDRVSEYFISNEPNKAALNAPSGNKENIGDIGTISKNDSETPIEIKNGHVNGIGTFIHPNSIDMAMAKLIPIVNGLGHGCGQNSPDPWIQQLVLDDRIKLLGANIYEAFGHK
ncbi:hypothetical protein R5R35_005419 [Gryllus longicercus]|uniref:Peroxisomal biogenesis factor 3 n=1 Tax=Gryllus longicercus TaxID=2509291 RepID=A0AAN9V9N6_9ORTH